MNIRKALPLVVSSLALALAAQASHAADNLVTQAQLDQLKPGISVDEVTRVLGAPEDTTSWMNGTRSMVYELSSHDSDQKLVYVDLGKDGKMADVQIIAR